MNQSRLKLLLLSVALPALLTLVPGPASVMDAQVAASVEHMKRAAAAQTCLNGCSGTSWHASNTVDGKMDTAWSSALHTSSNNYEWFAFWFQNGRRDEFSWTNYIRIRPRIHNGSSGHIPETVNIYYVGSSGTWTYHTTVNLPANVGAGGHRVDFSAVQANGILLTTNTLRNAPWDTGGYYFQLAEADAGYSNCSQWSGDVDMVSWCDNNPAYFDNVIGDTHYRANTKVKFGVNTSYGGAMFELFGKDRNSSSDFIDRSWTPNLIHPNGGSAMQMDLYGVIVGTGLPHTRCPGIPSTPWDNVWNAIVAMGHDCEWNTTTNDITGLALPSDRVHAEKFEPGQFPHEEKWSDLFYAWAPILRDSYVELPSHFTYTGSTTFGTHPQNVPVVFTGQGVNYKFYYYGGSNSTCGADTNVTAVGPYTDWTNTSPAAPSRFLVIDGKSAIHSGNEIVATAKESWVTACDESESRCLTLATKKSSSEIREFQISRGDVGSNPARHGAMAFVTQFQIAPNLDRHVGDMYVFPYKYSDVVNGTQTVRSVICGLQ